MKRLLFVVLVALALPAGAQESYTIDATAIQVTKFVEQGRLQENANRCRAAGLPDDCSIAELRAVEGHESDTLFADSGSGRQSYIRSVLLVYFQKITAERRRRDRIAHREAWEAGDTEKRDAMCAAVPLPAGCQLH